VRTTEKVDEMKKDRTDKPKYWLARSEVDGQDMNQLFADYGIWYANSGAVANSLRRVSVKDFIALVRTPDTVHALGRVERIKTAHAIGYLPHQGKNDLRIFFIESTDQTQENSKGWKVVAKKAPYTLRRALQQVKKESHIKAIWGPAAIDR